MAVLDTRIENLNSGTFKTLTNPHSLVYLKPEPKLEPVTKYPLDSPPIQEPKPETELEEVEDQ